MKIQNLFCAVFMVLMLVSCDTEFETDNDNVSDVKISTRTLTCLEGCNDLLVDCWDGNGQEGEGVDDFLEYRDCRCPDGASTTEQNDDCVWMGNNLNNPDALDCQQLYQLWADYYDLCMISYTVCVNNCSGPHGGDGPDPGINTGPKGDCDNDNIPNGVDPTPGC